MDGNLCEDNSNNLAVQIPTDYNSLNYDYDKSDQSFPIDDSVTICRSLVFVDNSQLGQLQIDKQYLQF